MTVAQQFQDERNGPKAVTESMYCIYCITSQLFQISKLFLNYNKHAFLQELTLRELWHEVDGLGLGPQTLSGPIDPHIHALGLKSIKEKVNTVLFLTTRRHTSIYLLPLVQTQVPVEDGLVGHAVVVGHLE